MSARTLIDVSRDRQDPFEKGMILTFADSHDIMKTLPFRTLGRVEIGHRRTNSASTVGFRSRGERYGGVAKRGYDEVIDATYAMGAEIDVDKRDLKDKGLSENPMVKAVREAMEDLSWTFRYHFVNGDQASEPDGFDGLIVRHANMASSQTTYAIASNDHLDMSRGANTGAGPTLADSQTLLDAIDDTIATLDGGKADIALTTRAAIRGIKRAMRRASIYKDTDISEPMTDDGRQRRSFSERNLNPGLVYAGVKFYDMGVAADQTTQIIDDETVDSVSCDPIFFLKIGEDGYLHGIEQYAIDVSPTMLLDDGVTYRTVVDWPCGLHHVHPKSIAKMTGVKWS